MYIWPPMRIFHYSHHPFIEHNLLLLIELYNFLHLSRKLVPFFRNTHLQPITFLPLWLHQITKSSFIFVKRLEFFHHQRHPPAWFFAIHGFLILSWIATPHHQSKRDNVFKPKSNQRMYFPFPIPSQWIGLQIFLILSTTRWDVSDWNCTFVYLLWTQYLQKLRCHAFKPMNRSHLCGSIIPLWFIWSNLICQSKVLFVSFLKLDTAIALTTVSL